MGFLRIPCAVILLLITDLIAYITLMEGRESGKKILKSD